LIRNFIEQAVDFTWQGVGFAELATRRDQTSSHFLFSSLAPLLVSGAAENSVPLVSIANGVHKSCKFINPHDTSILNCNLVITLGMDSCLMIALLAKGRDVPLILLPV
jgi:hypothetical protein